MERGGLVELGLVDQKALAAEVDLNVEIDVVSDAQEREVPAHPALRLLGFRIPPVQLFAQLRRSRRLVQ